MTEISQEAIDAFLNTKKGQSSPRAHKRINGVRVCNFCERDGLEPRKSYHEECKVLAKEKAQDEKRRCKKCRKTKNPDAFSNDSSRPDGKFPWCKECQTINNGVSKFQNPEDPLTGKDCPMCDTPLRGKTNRKFCSQTCYNRAHQLKLKFNLTPGQFRSMIPSDGRCPICRKRTRSWHVDHNHQTLKVMGPVCSPCNMNALAWTFHDVEFVERLLDFLKNPPSDKVGVEAFANPLTNNPSQKHTMWSRGPNSKAGKSKYKAVE